MHATVSPAATAAVARRGSLLAAASTFSWSTTPAFCHVRNGLGVEQWFISMEGKLPGGTLRSRALEEIKKVKWDPAWGEERISNMVATRPDWCISRQRIWGV